ncbi:hypothetical protein Pint_05054 [Pistacia integerrima]|uniref:Uncharacterized protein n=1 Tax=Pistacia integerrima TaxID=434235 RepID=A0ACC0Z435_9ROSI|nr:hypothetical protein Pint_05054 [Pistacia integerrima]
MCSMNAKHKESEDKLMKEKGILKRAIIIQHQRHHKEEDELKKMKKLVLGMGYEEQLKALEGKNNGVDSSSETSCSTGNSSTPRRFPPDVF